MRGSYFFCSYTVFKPKLLRPVELFVNPLKYNEEPSMTQHEHYTHTTYILYTVLQICKFQKY